MKELLNRREFLTGNLKSALGLFGQMIIPTIDQERTFIRPPGAQDEIVFLTSCTRCGICRDVCPVTTIQLFNIESGAKLAGTPFLNPNEIACTYCNECSKHCPTDALEVPENGMVPPIGIAKVMKKNCIAYQDVMCDYCIRACPISGALTLENGKPKVDSDFCNGCGQCVASCIQHDTKGLYVKALSSLS
ncbi:4Fe-4S dicluster domain-containing protein [Schinkia azotoformans]|uniref:4Fe-4S dicluster domain-containing protein n=1 Tax=Schinkia azotoformans TaxID=1454 RepID=UPI002DB8C57E|nr:4Fe-4S dicluster domain-containing protein [Schinkia azotoformans]MEC1719418.1 4Fe-4S dicluster domain-containing protein [Schinkia azotoformans]MED4415556.1 4Fe-4S dicluster domain-containing protein [Schinkia azotoformans]